ncbi:MAG: DUF3267 domain-containing protein [Paludibacter sp.]|nr:DUF3267 domain-containing protein [Paludibacter sp.]
MTYKELKQNSDFSEIAVLEHKNLKEMLVKEITDNSGWSRVANMYQITGVLAFVLGGFKAFMPFFVHREAQYLIWLSYGLLFTFSFLIVFHELVHAAAYKLVGAKELSFGMDLKKFMFWVMADKQVLNYEQFKKVALAPAVIVAVLSIFGMVIFYTQPYFFFFLPIFAFHSLFCAGDFGLLCFFQNRPEQEIVTYDIKIEGKTYFYAKQNI